jgi:DNA invertase Pin-like site-specific DNA recombinase
MKVTIYARLSSEQQDSGLLISALHKALRKWASCNEYATIEECVGEA